MLSSLHYQDVEPDIIVAAITSNLSGASEFDYRLVDWSEAGLRLPSALKPVIATIDPRRVVHAIGHLTASDLAAVDARLRSALGL